MPIYRLSPPPNPTPQKFHMLSTQSSLTRGRNLEGQAAKGVKIRWWNLLPQLQLLPHTLTLSSATATSRLLLRPSTNNGSQFLPHIFWWYPIVTTWKTAYFCSKNLHWHMKCNHCAICILAGSDVLEQDWTPLCASSQHACPWHMAEVFSWFYDQ